MIFIFQFSDSIPENSTNRNVNLISCYVYCMLEYHYSLWYDRVFSIFDGSMNIPGSFHTEHATKYECSIRFKCISLFTVWNLTQLLEFHPLSIIIWRSIGWIYAETARCTLHIIIIIKRKLKDCIWNVTKCTQILNIVPISNLNVKQAFMYRRHPTFIQ